jgi:hypothetical protein
MRQHNAFSRHPEVLREELSIREGFIAADKLIKTIPLPFHRQRGFSVGFAGLRITPRMAIRPGTRVVIWRFIILLQTRLRHV